MRPIHLTIEGLTCFKEKQEIDFSELELFAISGPTGAGKSTLLDAMLLALYGVVPRVGKHDLRELISAARDRVSVLFDFGVGDQRYRITRTLRRKGAATVRLDRHDGTGFNENVADQVKSAREAITRLLGLDDDAFTQAVMLPQGEFARFLQADPADRRSMLRTLLRLDVYERMRDAAQRVSNARKAECDSLRRLLDSEYAGVTDDALAALKDELATASTQLDAKRTELEAAQKQAGRLRTLREKTVELEEKKERHRELGETAAEIEVVKAELEAARRAGPLVPVVEEASRASAQATRAREEAEQARAAHDVAAKTHEASAALLERADAAAAEVATLRDHVSRLNQVIGRLPERDRLTDALDRQRTDLESTREKAAGLARDLVELSEAQRAQQAAAQTARAELERILYDASLDTALGAVRDIAARLSVLREGLTTAEAEWGARQQNLADLTQRIERLAHEAREATRVELEARGAFDAAERDLHRAHQLDAANHLRVSLEAGQACPVCAQVVDDPPPADLRPEVEAAKAAREDAARTLQLAQREARARQDALTRERGNADAARRAAAVADRARGQAGERVARQDAEIRATLGGRGPIDGQAIDAWVEQQVRISSTARRAHGEAARRLEEAERNVVKTEETRNTTNARLHEAEQALRKLEGRLQDDEDRLATLQKEIEEVAQSPDPESERDALVARIADLESGQKRAAAAAAQTRDQLTAAKEALDLRTRAAAEAEEQASLRLRARDERLAQAGFEDAAAIEQAARGEDVQAALHEKVQAHEREAHSVGQRIEALETELGTERVSNEELANAERRFTELAGHAEALVGSTKRLEEQVAGLTRRLERGVQLRQQLQNEQAAHRLYDQLATDLRSDRFQAYVLEEAFTELVRGASQRLLALTSERYSLQFRDDQIVVVDHDNAGESRISDTLSGGETFLTSLALALELSDQVQRAAGAVHLDSLFIDEGFGSLDPDTLAVVSETIQSLQVGGRMVGIITHVPELRDEFTQQVLVTKHQGYSTVEVRVGAVV